HGELFGEFANSQLNVVVTLAWETNSSWPEIGEGPRWWIKSLAVSRRCRGRRFGERVMEQSEAVGREGGADEMFFDCVDAGFRPEYYPRRGHVEAGRKRLPYSSGNPFPMVLMRKKLVPAPPRQARGFTPQA